MDVTPGHDSSVGVPRDMGPGKKYKWEGRGQYGEGATLKKTAE